ncbi:MAG: thiolase domain-containing protein [Chloroflexi bacterium]|nr:MAG: thiolase domain-containing protein [Chloroflexota bacterium]
MRPVSIVGIGQVPVQKHYPETLRELGARVVQLAMADAGVDAVDALFAGNMLSDELQSQKHIAALVADEAGLEGVEALQVRAATATGAAALRMAFFAVSSGEADLAIAVGVEKMSEGIATPALAKALDSRQEVPTGATLISKNAELMRLYQQTYRVPPDGLAHFSVNAHQNALTNPIALFHKPVTAVDIMASRIIADPIRLFDCSPICDGAAAVVLAPTEQAGSYTDAPVKILASSVATDRFRIADRSHPLVLHASRLAVEKAFQQSGITHTDVSLFEVHDAFSIMACLLLEATGFARPGEGWLMARDGEIGRNGRLPLSTLGGLKARGHPIGATALYQTCEIVQQLTYRAGPNQVENAQIGLLQSVGGAAVTVLTHILGV